MHELLFKFVHCGIHTFKLPIIRIEKIRKLVCTLYRFQTPRRLKTHTDKLIRSNIILHLISWRVYPDIIFPFIEQINIPGRRLHFGHNHMTPPQLILRSLRMSTNIFISRNTILFKLSLKSHVLFDSYCADDCNCVV